MPFWYRVPIPALSDPQPQVVRLVEWLLDVGDQVHRGTEIATVEAPEGRFRIFANGDGFLRERLFPAGAEVESSSPIATIASDGENIPYNKGCAYAEPTSSS
jgi:pyruvate/2-oxoglutarate dehydrogenase complex dihydrolipoamide acyltransferase (E2) component